MRGKLWILARQGLADLSQADDADLLLLEGSWDEGVAPAKGDELLFPRQRFALDTLLDSRWGWIDEEAAQLANLAAEAPLRFPSLRPESLETPSGQISPRTSEGHGAGRLVLRPEWIDALALRYAMVRWLRVVTFLTQIQPLQPGQAVEAFLRAAGDEDYGLLLEQLARKAEANLTLHWQLEGGQEAGWLAPNRWWRRCLGRWLRKWNPSLCPSGRKDRASARPCVLLCGNPRILDPVCQALIDQQVRVWWLYERFAVRAWFRWRRFGVGQLWCDQCGPSFSGADKTTKSFSPSAPSDRGHRARSEVDQEPGQAGLGLGGTSPLEYQGIDLGPVVRQWVSRRLRLAGGRYRQWIEAVESHLARLRPQAVLLDEDATPFARVVVAGARSQGIPTWVVQHGAPYVRFGFAPLEADYLCAWDQASFQRFCQWGIPKERIRITGSPWQERLRGEIRRRRHSSGRARRSFVRFRSWRRGKKTGVRALLLTTVPPRDHRPDPVSFHLTTRTYAKMLRAAFAAAARMEDAQLIVKLHPRCGDDPWIEAARHDFPHLPVRLVRKGSLAECLVQADCVLSCVSSAGVDAVWAGWPVIHLVPEGASESLPAEQWGFVGAARTEEEIYTLLCRVRSGWHVPETFANSDSSEMPRTTAQDCPNGSISGGTDDAHSPTCRGKSSTLCGTPRTMGRFRPPSSRGPDAGGSSLADSLVPEASFGSGESALSAAERIAQTVLQTIDAPASWETSPCDFDGENPSGPGFYPSGYSEKMVGLD